MNILLSDGRYAYDWPVLLPHDNIEVYAGQDFDFALAEYTPKGRLEGYGLLSSGEWSKKLLLESLPFRGPKAWYHKSVLDYAREKCPQDFHITHCVKASCYIPKEHFGKAVQRILDALPEDRVSDRDLRKEFSHRLPGMFGRRQQTLVSAKLTSTEGDARMLCATYHTNESVSTLIGDHWLVRTEKNKCTRASYMPLYWLIIDLEATLLARVIDTVQGPGIQGCIYEINTDSVLYNGPLLPETDELRCKTTAKDRMKGVRSLSIRSHEPPSLQTWTEIGVDDVKEHVLSGKSLCIEGLAGCGKSHMFREIAKWLREAGKTVRMLGPTHVSVQNLNDRNAATMHRYAHLYGSGKQNRADVFIIDELGLADVHLIKEYSLFFAHSKAQVIVGGDRFQLPAVARTYMGYEPSREIWDSDWLKQRCDFTRLHLKECHRADSRLFNYYSKLTTDNRDVKILVQEACQQFPPRQVPFCMKNLVMRHTERIRLNALIQDQMRPAGALFVQANTKQGAACKNLPQDMFLYPGLEVIAAAERHGRNLSYFIIKVTEEEVSLSKKNGPELKLKPAQVCEEFRLPYAVTYYAAQGLGFPEVRLWGCNSPNFTRAYLIVGLSRCYSADTVDIVQYAPKPDRCCEEDAHGDPDDWADEP